jgi:hypothetical protein
LRLRYTINYKSDSNYDYWYTRAKMEQTADALAAREAMFNASRTFKQGDPFGARKLYEQGFAKWRQVIDAFPEALENESSTGDDIVQFILQYRNVLDQMDEELGEEFPLWDVVERFDNEQKLQDELDKHLVRIGREPLTPQAEEAAPAETAAPAEKATEAPAEGAADEKPAAEATQKPAAETAAPAANSAETTQSSDNASQ